MYYHIITAGFTGKIEEKCNNNLTSAKLLTFHFVAQFLKHTLARDCNTREEKNTICVRLGKPRRLVSPILITQNWSGGAQ